jgi:pimeloyl-ACP methyl ester carboxylesterase
MRAYAPSDVPVDGRYQTGALVADACGLHDALGGDEGAVLIGHDWGALAAYGAASFAPERWDQVVAAAVPPPPAIAAGFVDYDQLRRSWYIFFFQSPLAEGVVGMGDLAFIDRLWADWSPGYEASDDLVRVKESIGSPDRLAGAIGYYRALFDPSLHSADLAAEQAAAAGIPPQPTLYIHGGRDGCMGVGLVDGLQEQLSPGSRVVVVPEAGHFLHLEKPAEVNRLVLDFLAQRSS